MTSKREIKAAKECVPGSALASAALVERALAKTGLAVHKVQNDCEAWENHDIILRSIRFTTKFGAAGEWLVIVKADTSDGPQIAFHGGETFAEAVSGLSNRIRNGTLKWRVDEYGNS